MYQFTIGTLGGENAISPILLDAMLRLRYEAFHKRLNWEVRVDQGRECDEYDDADTTYVIAHEPGSDRVLASWRLRATTGNYMLKDSFPQILRGAKAPRCSSMLEVSRFVVDHRGNNMRDGMNQFRNLTKELFAHTVKYAFENNVQSGIWVTTLGVERLGQHLGYSLKRFSPPMPIGHTIAVVQKVELDAASILTAERQLGIEFGQVRKAA